ncbi:MAG TPA: ABC transporter substrate-binding protein [Pseudolabrys sp.]|nr:ABC transporter substrate-binding protein [Pseudolabrys sp.]
MKPVPFSRRHVLAAGSATLAMPFMSRGVRAAPINIRYATGGGIGPNEMETIIFLDHLKQNVLKNYGKSYTLEMTFTRGTPEAATLLASGQVDLATQSFATFAVATTKNAVPGGLTIISDNYQDGHKGNASNTFFVLKDSPIKSIADLKGKKVGVNAFGSAVDLVLRVVLKKNKLDPKSDVQIVEVNFPNMAAAIREKRIDCGVLVIPFLAVESPKGDLRALFTGGDAFGPSSVIFQVAATDFLKKNADAVKGFLADYVTGLAWYYDKANRAKALELVSAFTKSPRDVLDSYFATPRDYYRDPNGCLTADVVQKPIDAMLEEKLIPAKVDAAKYIDLSYLPHPCAK